MSIVFAIGGTIESGGFSVVNLACKLLDGLSLAIPYTTRAPKVVDNRDSEFFLTSREVFEQMIAREEFLEYVSILGNYYGTPRQYLQQARENGNDLLVQVDESGVAQIKQKIPDAVSILVLPGQSPRDMRALHLAANPTLPIFLQQALLPSLQEALQREFLRSPKPNPDKYDHIIVNDRLEDSADKMIEIIRSERLR